MIISIKSSASGGSSRGLVHYLAHSKFDREKEGVERREFFNESENDLDVRNANRHLSLTDAKPKPEELLHIVVAPSKEEIESVGDDLKTRKNSLKAIVREIVARLEKEVKAKKLKWIAALHFNTANSHAHLALQKEFLNESGKTEILRVTRQMLHYNEASEKGEKKLRKGALILAAENKIKEIADEKQRQRQNETEKTVEKSESQSEKTKPISSISPLNIANYQERRLLAEEMLVAAEIARRTRNIENLIEHGDKKRFKIKDDQTDITRHISLFDIERKIEITSRRKAQIAHPKNAEKRAEEISQLAQIERAKCEPVIQQLETIRRHVLGFENRHLSEAQEKHIRLHNQKLLIEKKYERLKTVAPLPLFKSDEIQQLQAEAFREQNIEKILLLESIRQSNATELNRPSRRDLDVREFLAVKIVAALKHEGAEKRMIEFPKIKQFVKVKIGNSYWSHYQLEQHELQNTPKSDFWTRVKAQTSKVLFRSDEKSKTAEKLDYPALHKEIDNALENLEITRLDDIKKQKEFNQTLDKIFEAETNPNKAKLTPAFSPYELAETEDLANDVGREEIYEKSLYWQENWLRENLAAVSPTQSQTESQSLTHAEKIIGNYVSGRAEARNLIAQTKVNRAEEKLARYERGKFFVKHKILHPKTGAEIELSLKEVEPKKHYYMLDNLLEMALETKEQKIERDLVKRAAQNKEKGLTLNLKNARNHLSRLENQKTAMLEKYSIENEIQPVFTPKEVAALVSRRIQTMDKSEAAHLEKIINQAEKNGCVERIQVLLQSAAKELQALSPTFAKNQETKISDFNDLTERGQTTGYGKEIPSQNPTVETTIPSSRNSAKTETIEREKTIVKEKGRSR